MKDNTDPAEQIILVLQGGGALGAYQAGAYEALAEAGREPEWLAGISIGSINGALIAGNRPGRRLEALRQFWESVTGAPCLAVVPMSRSSQGMMKSFIPRPPSGVRNHPGNA